MGLFVMSRVCKITKRRYLVGNNRSHSMNASKRKFFLNLQERRFWISSEKRYVRLKVSAKGIRYIEKRGIEYFICKKSIK